ncbi:MAG TPA: hypothetical protein VGK71_06700 [Nitrospirota bacterium]|jgi:hypothetical protein
MGENNEKSCEFLPKCGFFLNFKANAEVIKQGWARMYCQTGEKAAKCMRKKLREETGQAPPDNMAPTGDIIRLIKIDKD